LFVEELYRLIDKHKTIGLDICGILETVKLDIWTGTIAEMEKRNEKKKN